MCSGAIRATAVRQDRGVGEGGDDKGRERQFPPGSHSMLIFTIARVGEKRLEVGGGERKSKGGEPC